MGYNPPSFTNIQQYKIISVTSNTSNYSALYNSLSSAAYAYLHAECVDSTDLGFKSAVSINPDDATTGFNQWLSVTNINQLSTTLKTIAETYESALVNKIITADDAFKFITEYLYETCAIRTCTYKYYTTTSDTNYTTWKGVGLYFRYDLSQDKSKKTDISSKYVDTLDNYRQKVSTYAQESGIKQGQVIKAENCNSFIQKLLKYNASKQKIYDFGARNAIENEPPKWVTYKEDFGHHDGTEYVRQAIAERTAVLIAEYGTSIGNIHTEQIPLEGYVDQFYLVYDLLESSCKKKLVATFPELVITDKYN